VSGQANIHPFLFTVGYEGLNVGEFTEKLKDSGISFLVDVREIPLSRKKGFSKTKLAEYLKNHNIGYMHLRDLGSPKELRRKLKEDGDYSYFFNEFAKYMRTKKEAIEQLYTVVSEQKCCIMCFEKEPENCHRSIVADEIKRRDGNGLAVKHL
jgi:uncharacterized protein (DUF488 family)